MKKDILFGICADIHHQKHSDERWRVEKFVSEATERGADFIKRPIPDVIAMPKQDDIGLEIFCALDQFLIGDMPSPLANPQRRQKPRHIAIGKFADAPAIADSSAV